MAKMIKINKKASHEEICQQIRDAQTIITVMLDEDKVTYDDTSALYKAWTNLQKVFDSHLNK